MSYFDELNSVNVNDKTEPKNGLTYLSWCFAWGEIKKHDPNAFYTIYENADGLFYHTDGKTAWVKTGVTVHVPYGDEIVPLEHIEYLPVMDYKNRSISVENITSTDVNKAIQRSITKACARHGLGLYIYAGEDLPEVEKNDLANSDEKITEKEVKLLERICDRKGIQYGYKGKKFEELTGAEYAEAMKALGKRPDKEKA